MIEEKIGIVVSENVVEQIVTCDVCGARADRYINVCTGHYDWYEDSGDSIRNHQCCCWDCAVKFMEKWKESSDAKRKTSYIEFEQEKAIKASDRSYEEYLKLKAYYDKKELEF